MFAFVLLAAAAPIRVAAAPAGEPLSKRFSVSVDRQVVPVYVARIAPGDPERWKRLTEDGGRTPGLYDEAAFASWDMRSPAKVRVGAIEPIREFRILPVSAGIKAEVQGRTLTFSMKSPDPRLEVLGFDGTHGVRHVTFDRVRLGGIPLSAKELETNAFASEIRVVP